MDVVAASPAGAKINPETFEYMEGGDQDAAREALESEAQRKRILEELQARVKKQQEQKTDAAQEGE